jgi:hypothetical protein
MKTFKQFLKPERVEENAIRKGAVSLYAVQGKRHGDAAVRHFKIAQQSLTRHQSNNTIEEKIDAIEIYLKSLSDGLIEIRNQIGSISAQITSSNVV